MSSLFLSYNINIILEQVYKLLLVAFNAAGNEPNNYW